MMIDIRDVINAPLFDNKRLALDLRSFAHAAAGSVGTNNGIRIVLDKIQCETFRLFMKRLNRAVYGNAAGGVETKSSASIPVVEKSTSKMGDSIFMPRLSRLRISM